MSRQRIQSTTTRSLLLVCLLQGCSKSEPGANVESAESIDAAPAAALDSRPNAAHEYRRIRSAMGSGFMEPLVNVGTATPPRGAEAQFLMNQQPLILQIIAASKLDRCDFETDWSRGPDVDLSHFSTIRHCTMLLQHDAHRLISSAFGQTKAAERLAGILRMAQHIGNEPTMLAKLVAFACTGVALESLRSWNSKLTDASSRAQLSAELHRLIAGDMFNSQEVLSQELLMLKQEVRNGGRKGFGNIIAAVPIDSSEQGAVIAELERVFAALEVAWTGSDAIARTKTITDAIRVPKAKALLAGLDRFKVDEDRIQREVKAAISRLEAPAH